MPAGSSTALTPRRRATTVTAALLALPLCAAVVLMTLTPIRVEDAAPGLVFGAIEWLRSNLGAGWFTFDVAERLANVLLFVPVGVLAYLILPRSTWPVALLVGPAISVAIELTQRFVLTDRASTMWDVVANTAGSFIGVAIAAACTLAHARTAVSRSPA